MALNLASAEAVANAFCAANGISDQETIDRWISFVSTIYFNNSGAVVNALGVTLATNTVTTVGSPSSQVGPTSPVSLGIS